MTEKHLPSWLRVVAAQQSANAGILGPADPVSHSAGSVTPQKSGTYLAIATMSGTTSGPDRVGVTLMVDGGAVATVDAASGTSNGWAGTVGAVVTVSTTASHTWALEAATFGGVVNITVPAGRAILALVEL